MLVAGGPPGSAPYQLCDPGRAAPLPELCTQRPFHPRRQGGGPRCTCGGGHPPPCSCSSGSSPSVKMNVWGETTCETPGGPRWSRRDGSGGAWAAELELRDEKSVPRTGLHGSGWGWGWDGRGQVASQRRLRPGLLSRVVCGVLVWGSRENSPGQVPRWGTWVPTDSGQGSGHHSGGTAMGGGTQGWGTAVPGVVDSCGPGLGTP